MNLEDIASPFTWQYDSTIGLLNHLTYPNGMVRTNTYHPRLNLITAIGYRKGEEEELATCHEYGYDALMRPIQRRDFWDSSTTPEVRDFTYNDRSELVKDRIGRGESFSYQYDNIGNRKAAQELEKKQPTNPTRSTSTRRLPGKEKILTPPTTPTATRPGSRLQQASGKCPTTPMTAPLSSPARMDEPSSPAATTTGDGALKRRSPSMGQCPAIPDSCTGAICM